MKTFNCQYCGTECKFSYSSRNKFCSSKCAGFAKQELAWKRVEAGEGATSTNSTVRQYLIAKRGPHCEECNTGITWNGLPLTLHVDHIDGDAENMAVENLRLLCPNCHSQTPYGSKNKRTGGKRKQYYETFRNGQERSKTST